MTAKVVLECNALAASLDQFVRLQKAGTLKVTLEPAQLEFGGRRDGDDDAGAED